MDINLNTLNYSFKKKPLLVGGMAMEYYGLRKAGKDIDLIADENDVIELIKIYPNKVKNLYADLGVCPFEFEIWRTINLLTYDELKTDAIEEKDFLIISLEKLLFMKALGIHKDKYLQDAKLIVNKLSKNQINKYDQENKHVNELLTDIQNIIYIEATGPNKI